MTIFRWIMPGYMQMPRNWQPGSRAATPAGSQFCAPLLPAGPPEMSREYCTYFDHRYAARGIAMIRSLRRHELGARVWVLCLDDAVYDLFKAIQEPGVQPLRLADFERDDSALAAARNDGRTKAEFYFTCTPTLIRYVMAAVPDAEWVTYLDGDLWFFSSPESIYEETGTASVTIIPHRYPPALAAMEKYGTYNVGWVSFRRAPDGTACLNWWRERCLEWCMDIVDAANDRYADQRYLDRFSALFGGICILQNPGANLAPWNLSQYKLSHDGRNVLVEGHTLVFFHFHALKRLGSRRFVTSHGQYGAGLDRVTRTSVYRPYLQELLTVERQIAPLLPKTNTKPLRQGAPRAGTILAKMRTLRDFARTLRALAFGLTVHVPRDV